ncbi:MAG: hypothetical protein HQK49_21955 [Oligoflexia bacterium]|nr:hypothetical protein [Oligoflexia bacterium]
MHFNTNKNTNKNTKKNTKKKIRFISFNVIYLVISLLQCLDSKAYIPNNTDNADNAEAVRDGHASTLQEHRNAAVQFLANQNLSSAEKITALTDRQFQDLTADQLKSIADDPEKLKAMWSTVADRLARGVQFSDDNLRALINSVGPSDLLKVLPINDVTFLSSPQLARVLSPSQSQAITDAKALQAPVDGKTTTPLNDSSSLAPPKLERILPPAQSLVSEERTKTPQEAVFKQAQAQEFQAPLKAAPQTQPSYAQSKAHQVPEEKTKTPREAVLKHDQEFQAPVYDVWTVEKIMDLKTSSFEKMSWEEIEKMLKTLFVTDHAEVAYWGNALKAGFIDGKTLLSGLSNRKIIAQEKTVLFIDKYNSITLEAGSEVTIDYSGYEANHLVGVKLITGTLLVAIGESSTTKVIINDDQVRSATTRTYTMRDGNIQVKKQFATAMTCLSGSSIPGADSGGLSKSVTVSAKIHLRNKQ